MSMSYKLEFRVWFKMLFLFSGHQQSVPLEMLGNPLQQDGSIHSQFCHVIQSPAFWLGPQQTNLSQETNYRRAGSTFFFPYGKDYLLVLLEVANYFLNVVGDNRDTRPCFVFYLLKIQTDFIRSDKTRFLKVHGFLTNHRVRTENKIKPASLHPNQLITQTQVSQIKESRRKSYCWVRASEMSTDRT